MTVLTPRGQLVAPFSVACTCARKALASTTAVFGSRLRRVFMCLSPGAFLVAGKGRSRCSVSRFGGLSCAIRSLVGAVLDNELRGLESSLGKPAADPFGHVINCQRARRQYIDHGEERMHLAFEAAFCHGNARLLKESSVGLPFLPQDVVFGADDEGGGQTREGGGSQGRGVEHTALRSVREVLVPEPRHVFPAEQQLVGWVKVARAVQISLKHRISQYLEGKARTAKAHAALGQDRGQIGSGAVPGNDQRRLGASR